MTLYRVLLVGLILSASIISGCTKQNDSGGRNDRTTSPSPSLALRSAPADRAAQSKLGAEDRGRLKREPVERKSLVAGAGAPPNILFIFTDDQSPGTVGCYGEVPWARTPNIDRLAAEGVRFTHAYGAPSCTISRAILLTGRHQHGIQTLNLLTKNQSYDPQVCRFWPAVLRQRGYETSLIGKWHLGPDAGHGRDWDHSLVWRQMPGAHRLENKDAWYFNPPLQLDGSAEQTTAGYATDLYTRAAVDFVRREHQKPWFLFLSYNAPHGPLLAHPRHKQRYVDAPVPPPGDPETVREYHRLVCAIDEGIGALRAALEETGQLDNTLIVFTSDQGYSFGEHGVTGKLAHYDANMRIPLIVRYPGEVPSGTVCRHPVGLIDLSPTLLSFAGVPAPWTMHGHNLRPLLKDPQSSWDHPVLIENFYLHYGQASDVGKTTGGTLFGIPWWISLTQGHYKYVRLLLDNPVEELYDLKTDPEELTNLAEDQRLAAVLADYRARLESELRRTDARLVDNMPQPQR